MVTLILGDSIALSKSLILPQTQCHIRKLIIIIGTVWDCYEDEKKKNDVKPFELYLVHIKKLHVKCYHE